MLEDERGSSTAVIPVSGGKPDRGPRVSATEGDPADRESLPVLSRRNLLAGFAASAAVSAVVSTRATLAPVGSIVSGALAAQPAPGRAGLTTVGSLRALSAATGLEADVAGWHMPGDGGGGRYRADPSDTATADNGGTVIVDAAGTRWKLQVTDGRVTSRQFGVRADCTGTGLGTDDRDRINALIAWCATAGHTAVIAAGNHRITMRPDTVQPAGIVMRSGVDVVCEPGAVFTADGTDTVSYQIVKAYDCTGWSWTGGRIVGERYAHTGTKGEQGMGFSVRGCTDFTMDGVEAVDCWGDGFYFGATPAQNWCENGRVTDLKASNNRRNNVSIISAKDFLGARWTLKNANGTPPMSGVDIEPNSEHDYVENVVFEDFVTEDNDVSGIVVSLAVAASPVSVSIRGHRSKGDQYGFRANTKAAVSGTIDYENFLTEDTWYAGVGLATAAAGPRVRVANGEIRRPNASGVDSSITGSGVTLTQPRGGGRGVLGNVEIENVSVIDDRDTPRMTKAITVVDQDGSGVRAVTIRNPPALVGATGSPLLLRGALAGTGRLGDSVIEDAHGQLRTDLPDASVALSTASLARTYSNRKFTTTRMITLPPPGASSNFRLPQTFVIEVARTLRLAPGAGVTIVGEGSTGAGKYIQSNEIGARLTLMQVDAKRWRIGERSGSWTWQR